MAIEQIKRKLDKMKKAQKDCAARETPLPPKKDNGPNEPTHLDATGVDIDLTRKIAELKSTKVAV